MFNLVTETSRWSKKLSLVLIILDAECHEFGCVIDLSELEISGNLLVLISLKSRVI